MTTPQTARPVDLVLVGPLRSTGRSSALLTALDGLAPRLQAVLRAGYLDGRTDEDVAAELLLTPAELVLVRGDALRALGRLRVARPRAAVAATPYSRS